MTKKVSPNISSEQSALAAQQRRQRFLLRSQARADKKRGGDGYNPLADSGDGIVLPQDRPDDRKGRPKHTKTHRYCSGCRRLLANSHFAPAKSRGKTVLAWRCRPCMRANAAAKYDLAKRTASQRKWRAKVKRDKGLRPR